MANKKIWGWVAELLRLIAAVLAGMGGSSIG